MTVSDEMIGQRIGDYRILERIGAGGMSEGVYRARHEKLQNDVAVKVAHIGAGLAEDRRQRILSEPQRTARLSHPNIIKVYTVIDDGPRLYMVMDYVAGGDLLHRIDQHQRRELARRTLSDTSPTSMPMADEFAASVIQQVGRALDYAHNQGLIHRDIKPSNILVTDEGHVIVTDFGIAKALQATELSFTHEGVGIGTPPYMSPEQIRGEDLTPASDEYSLAVVAYQLLTGCLPFEGASAVVIAHKHLNEPPQPPRQVNPKLTRQTETVLLRGLAKQPSDRYGRAGTFGAQLARTLVSDSRELRLPTISLWKQVEQTRGWGLVLRIGRTVSTLMLGFLVTLLRSLAYILIGLALFLTLLLAGGSYLGSKFLENTIGGQAWAFDMIAGQTTSYSQADLQGALVNGLRTYFPGTIENVELQLYPPDGIEIRGDIGDRRFKIEGSVAVVAGAPFFRILEINDQDIRFFAGLLAGGLNRGFAAALQASEHHVASIEVGSDGIVILVEGPITSASPVVPTELPPGALMRDDFSNPDTGWTRSESLEATHLGYRNGVYEIAVNLPYLSAFQIRDVYWVAYDVSVDLRLAAGPQNATYGIVVLQQDNGSFISVLLSGDGFVLPEAVVDGKNQALDGWDGWRPVASASESDASDRLLVRVRPNVIDVAVNGEELGSGQVPRIFQGGRVGLMVRTASEGEAVVEFDNMEAYGP
jgi:hypothetical protein